MEPFAVEQIYCFIIGGTETGKSHLIKAVGQTIMKPNIPGTINIQPGSR